MKKGLFHLAAVGTLMTMCGCMGVVAPFKPPMGFVYTETKAPLDIDYDATKAATMKKGTATSTSILNLVATGDNSTATAAKNGGIKTIHYTDYEYKNILFIFQETKVNVYGE